MGTKGARLTTFVALPSRLMVYMPRGEGIGVSARIEDEVERARLKQLVTEAVPQQTTGGYIVRTAAQGAAAEAIREDIQYLGRLWQHVKEKGLRARPANWSTKTCRCPRASCATNWRAASTACWWTMPPRTSGMLEFAASFMPGSTTSIESVHRSASDLRPARRRGGNRQGAGAQRQPQVRAATWSSTRPNR